MMDAYVVDQMKKGSWSDIGYTAPSSKNFKYTASDWNAEATFGTDTPCDGKWSVTVTVADEAAEASYNASTACTNLTPNFKNIGAGSGSGS